MIYISGRISNNDPAKVERNLAEFDKAAVLLVASGVRVFNPAQVAREYPGKSYAWYMRYDLAALVKCVGVAVLPGWTGSKGATLEVAIANACDIPVHGVNVWVTFMAADKAAARLAAQAARS